MGGKGVGYRASGNKVPTRTTVLSLYSVGLDAIHLGKKMNDEYS